MNFSWNRPLNELTILNKVLAAKKFSITISCFFVVSQLTSCIFLSLRRQCVLSECMYLWPCTKERISNHKYTTVSQQQKGVSFFALQARFSIHLFKIHTKFIFFKTVMFYQYAKYIDLKFIRYYLGIAVLGILYTGHTYEYGERVRVLRDPK